MRDENEFLAFVEFFKKDGVVFPKGVLSLISTNHDESKLRSSSIRCLVATPPVIGMNCMVIAPPLEKIKVIRNITTSIVNFVAWDDTGCTFKTSNSIYDLRIDADFLDEVKKSCDLMFNNVRLNMN